MVLDAKEKKNDTVSSSEYRRMVGGKIHHHGLSMVKKFPFAKHSGGSFSGGSNSGGAAAPSKLSKYY
jgi:hypothetical protein